MIGILGEQVDLWYNSSPGREYEKIEPHGTQKGSFIRSLPYWRVMHRFTAEEFRPVFSLHYS